MKDLLGEIMSKAANYVTDKQVSLTNVKEHDGHLTYYFKVGKYDITFNMEKMAGKFQPYSRQFECTCRHNSLFGAKHGIPCSHIFTVILWAGLAELMKTGGNSGRTTKTKKKNMES